MNQTELKSIETAMRETRFKQLYTRYQVIYLHLQGYKKVEIAKMVPFTAQTIGTHVRNYKKDGLEGLNLIGLGIVSFYVFGYKESLGSHLLKEECVTCCDA